MPLSRNTRMDRRKKLILESAEQTREYPKERRPTRSQRSSEDDEIAVAGVIRRDAGYSHSVRHACQFRLSQLIPVRRSSLGILIAATWLFWGLLLGAHYLLFVRPETAIERPPIAYLFYLRSYYSIGQWLGTQLWFMTALAALFIYLLRRHKLDDYRAKYRLWLVLIAAALFASLDSTTSSLKLLGDSIDTWSRAEVGYSGRALVLASFASMIGVLGLRLCGELRAAPTSVGFWLVGLIAWGVSALFGTELLILSWRQPVLDLFVGGLWLAGILSVWLSASIYLRHTYIHAQRRMVARAGMLQPLQFKMPKIRWPRRDELTEEEEVRSKDGDDVVDESSMKRGLSALTSIFRKKETDSSDTEDSEVHEKKRWLRWKRKVAAETDQPERENDSQGDHDREHIPKTRTASSVPVKVETTSARDTSIAAKRKNDSETDEETLSTKRRWWPKVFQRKSSGTDSIETGSDPQSIPAKAKKPVEVKPSEAKTGDSKKESREGEETKRRSLASRIPWFKRKDEHGEPIAKKSNEGSSKKKSDERANSGDDPSSSKDSATKGSWLSRFRRSKPNTDGDSETTAGKSAASKSEPKVAKPKPTPTKSEASPEGKRKGLFSFMDGLKLKPPAEENQASSGPSSSPQRPKPANSSDPLPSTLPIDDEEDSDDRNMTRAERKRLRREQMNQRRAA